MGSRSLAGTASVPNAGACSPGSGWEPYRAALRNQMANELLDSLLIGAPPRFAPRDADATRVAPILQPARYANEQSASARGSFGQRPDPERAAFLRGKHLCWPRWLLIRKLKSGEYRLYSRKKDPKSGKRRNLGTFSTRAAAEKHERAVQFFKHQ